MINFNNKVLIGSQSTMGTKIANELSKFGIYTSTRQSFSEETLRKHNAVLIDNTAEDMDEIIETVVSNPTLNVRTFVLTKETEQSIYDKNGVLFISESLETESICELIRHCVEEVNTHKRLEIAASKMLLYYGVQPNLKGYRYLVESVTMVAENPDFAFDINKMLYPAIAEIHGVKIASVERAIRTAIEAAYARTKAEKFEELFNYSTTKPWNSEFIAVVAEKIRIGFVS
ncbi:MAG: sporulation initiation factor Spo0A C-terminal domain-containing protein [Ruminococcus sp.]|nr:sporulation initiation factor Spo0A C-terminal domain-containing protein [Ruminococcus sp.]